MPTLAPPPPLDAEDLARWRACRRRFWLHRQPSATAAGAVSRPTARTPHGADTADRMVDGPGTAQALRASYPGLIVIDPPRDDAGWRRAIAITAQHLADVARQDEAWALSGACLAGDAGLRVRIDVVTRGPGGLRLWRRRHATAGSEADVDTVAAWLHVAARQGLRVQSAGLLLVDTGFVYPGHGLYAGLYREVDLAPVLGTRPVAQWLADLRATEAGPLPTAPLGAPCGGCEQREACALPEPGALPGAPAVDPRASLEIVGRELADTLRAEGHRSLLDVPPERLTHPRHRRAARAVQAGQPIVEPGAAAAWRDLAGPRRWLRIETIGFAIPPWAGTQPYQALPFQWSCTRTTDDGPAEHTHFLAGPGGDPRRPFAESLLQALGESGAILAYNAGFERNRIRELARRFDDLASPLEALQPRIVDLFMLLREHAYHPAMAGSWSARSVFGAWAPQAGAHRFAVELGPRRLDNPLQAYAASLRPDLSAADRAVLHEALRRHGQHQGQALQALTDLLETAG